MIHNISLHPIEKMTSVHIHLMTDPSPSRDVVCHMLAVPETKRIIVHSEHVSDSLSHFGRQLGLKCRGCSDMLSLRVCDDGYAGRVNVKIWCSKLNIVNPIGEKPVLKLDISPTTVGIAKDEFLIFQNFLKNF